VEGYRAEMGNERSYFNVPYFSSLQPYLAIDRATVLRDRQPRFLFSGALIERKGVDLLARAFSRLLEEGTDACLTLVGGGPLERVLRQALAPSERRVTFAGFQQWLDLPQFYAHGDILCAPSRYDGWGLVVVEGLAAGMPVISTMATGAARELVNVRNGWLLDANDEDALLSVMRKAALLDPVEHAKYVNEARKSVQRYTIAAGVDRFLEAAEQSIAEWIT
jgi:glycosyltransferase involved in cell wall biosynthesis